jgi:hypothetical protein
MASGLDRTGVMVVRVWIERSDGSLRARLTETLDLTTHEETSCAASSAEEIVEIVSRWVQAFAAAGT